MARTSHTPTTSTGGSPRLAGLARLMVRRRRVVVVAWVLAVVFAATLGSRVGGDFRVDYTTPGSESAAAAALVSERFGAAAGESVDVVWVAPGGAGDPAVLARIDRLVAGARGLEGLGEISAPQISPDGTTGLVRLELNRPSWGVPSDSARALIAAAQRETGEGVRIELGGAVIEEAEEGGSPEVVGLLAAIVVLLIAFGAVVAAGLPVVAALVGVGVSTGLIAIAALAFDIPDWAPAVAALIGIGVGIDYTLLILTRFRDALARGASVPDAVSEASATAGLSVLIAGGTVIVSLAGLFLMGVAFMNGVAVAAGLSVLVVMFAAITLVPALLGMLGHRVNALRLPRTRRRGGSVSAAARWARFVQRHPRGATLAALAVLLGVSGHQVVATRLMGGSPPRAPWGRSRL